MITKLPEEQLAVAAANLGKVYPRGREQVKALDNVHLQIRTGEFVAITGPSGSGKTTLLNLVGCMDVPTSGTLTLFGKSIHGLNDAERTCLRRHQIGFVFQHFGLVPTLSVAENVALPLLFARRKNKERVNSLLEKVRLHHRRDHRPHELSGGEMQRVAIARALINEPRLLLADEPTGNLDASSGEDVISLFQALALEGLTIMAVTHNRTLAQAAQREIELSSGSLRDVNPASLRVPAAFA